MLTTSNLKVTLSDNLILDDLSLEFKEGQITCIIGKNGSGKSTLLRALEGLIESEGSIYLDDIDLKEISIKEKAKLLSYLPQNRPTPQISGRLMVQHGRFPYLGFNKKISAEDNRIIDYAIDSIGIRDIIHKNLDSMSGGEVQKVYIASTLAQESKVILLDEPTNHLDLESQIEILKVVEKLKKDGKIVIIVMHDILQAMTYADKVYVLNDTKIVLEGEPSKLVRNDSINDIFKYTIIEDEDPKALYKYKLIEK